MMQINQIEIQSSLIFCLIIISFFFLGLLRAYYWKYTKLLILASFKYRYASQYLRQDNAFTERVNWLAFIVLIINFSLFFLFKNPEINLIDFLILVFLILAYYSFKYLTIKFLGNLLFAREQCVFSLF